MSQPQATGFTNNLGGVNGKIIVGAVLITAMGLYRAWQGKRPWGRVLFGGYALMIILSLFDLAGGAVSAIAGNLAMLAAFSGLLYFLATSDLLKRLNIGQSQGG